MYNALGGLGGSGQIDSTVAANATVALLAATAVTALFFVGPIFDLIGPRWCWFAGGWTYALYSGALLCYNRIPPSPFSFPQSLITDQPPDTKNAGFVIGSGAILGIGASFLWIAQGAIMTTYVPESQKGRAIAVFWIIFNLGGSVGSFVSLGLNYHSKAGTVSNSTYIAIIVIMAFGWLLGVFICSPRAVRMPQLEVEEGGFKGREVVRLWGTTMLNWRVACMLPLFFCANVFYSYQQNSVNGKSFTLRTRSLNGALYWFAQIFGGLFIGLILDFPKVSRPNRARIGWVILFVTGMAIWGGGYAFQVLENRRLTKGLKQDIDFDNPKLFVGPMFLYIFYGMYDALWQGFCYWIIGAESNRAAVTAVLVGAYKTFQATGGAMAWRINALNKPALTQLYMNWGLSVGALLIALPMVWTVSETSVHEVEGVEEQKVEFEEKDAAEGVGKV
ncbi:related to MFS transporter [Phialocephala subalpina]|uniref:Related to MFS transporter n=1 Tax=Phialocephala subalpina TaxID=576137 RepID=A0A1L7X916_9HELO|nr:related to MFS transporter [Phialocephala subalpina]